MAGVGVTFSGVEALQRRVQQLAYYARTNKVVKRGISDAARLTAKEIKDAAPVRKPRISVRIVNKLMKRKTQGISLAGQRLSKARRRASIVQKKYRKVAGGGMGPRQLIKPGQLKRSVGSRVKNVRDGLIMAKAGMNVGLRYGADRRAPHAHLVALGTKLRKTKLAGGRPGHVTGRMPPNDFARRAAATAVPQAMRALETAARADFNAAVLAVGGTVP